MDHSALPLTKMSLVRPPSECVTLLTSGTVNQQLETNPFAWTNEFHMIFMDNPVGAGFSYGSLSAYIRNETMMATYLENVLSQFMTKFPEYQTNPFFSKSLWK